MYAKWIIYYADGSSFSDLDGPPESAPRCYVQCVAVANIGCGHYVLGEQNFYCWHDDQWVPHDTSGLYQYLAAPGKEKIVLQGYWMDREKYFKMRRAARQDSRLPPQTAKGPREPTGELE